MLNNNYSMDEFILRYLSQVFTEAKYTTCVELFNTIYQLNTTYKNDVNLDLTSVESDIMSIINDEDEENDAKATRIDIYLTSMAKSYISRYGIYLNDQAYLFHIVLLLEAIYVVYTIDPNLSEVIIDELDIINDDTEQMRFARVFDQYCRLGLIDINIIVEDIHDDYFSTLKQYLIDTKSDEAIQAASKASEIVNTLTKIDQNFANTYIVKDMVANGYFDKPLQFYITEMYTNIERYQDNFIPIPLEVVATYYIATDTRDKLEESITQTLNLSAVSFLHDNENIVHSLEEMILDLVRKFKTRIMV